MNPATTLSEQEPVEAAPPRRFAWLIKLLGEQIPTFLLVVVLLLVVAEILSRNLLQISAAATSELIVLCFVWLVWLGVLGAARSDELMGVRFFRDRLGRNAWIAAGVADLVAFVICLGVTRAAYMQVTTARFERFDALGLPRWVLALSVLCGMAGLSLHFAFSGVRRLASKGASR
jgi:TRAP-type C4-dicarboxylate transport system permease small subunit